MLLRPLNGIKVVILKFSFVLCFSIALLCILISCEDFSFYETLDGNSDLSRVSEDTDGDADQTPELSIAPSSVDVAAGGSVTFSASGGTPPYAFSLTSGQGMVDSDSGVYNAPSSSGTAVVTVTDADGVAADASITVIDTGTLGIIPSVVNLTAGSVTTFYPSGGTGPYTFAILTNNSGSPGIGASSGIYIAGSTDSVSDTIQVQDAVLDTATAIVNITPAPDYTISADTFPGYGLSSGVFGGSFTIQELLGNTGGQPMDWKLFISTDSVANAGDTLEDSGAEPPLTGSGSSVVTFSGATWPSLVDDIYLYLVVTLDSGDDDNPLNDEYASAAIPIPSSTFTEAEPNNSPPPPGETASFQDLGTLGDGEMVGVVNAGMDGPVPGGYDTYRFTTGTGSINRVEVVCTWNTGGDDIDLYFWEDGAVAVDDVSEDTSSDREPDPGTDAFRITGLSSGVTYRVGVYFKTGASGTYSLIIQPN